VEYVSVGRVVSGQAKLDQAGLDVDWQNDVQVLSLKLPEMASKVQPNWEDFATTEAFQKARSEWLRSEARLERARQIRTYQLAFEEDGFFRVEDVPPGTYELRVRVTRPDKSADRASAPGAWQTEQEVAALVKEVVVPEGKEPLDLGTLIVPVTGNPDLVSPLPPPMRLQARTLDGKTMTLDQFKGRNVLVVFWMSWSDRSTTLLAEMDKLRAELGADTALALVSISLDDDIADARKAVAGHGDQWTHGWLDAKERAAASAAFDVNTLPTVLLLDTEGRVVARDLEGSRLSAVVKRKLAKQ